MSETIFYLLNTLNQDFEEHHVHSFRASFSILTLGGATRVKVVEFCIVHSDSVIKVMLLHSQVKSVISDKLAWGCQLCHLQSQKIRVHHFLSHLSAELSLHHILQNTRWTSPCWTLYDIDDSKTKISAFLKMLCKQNTYLLSTLQLLANWLLWGEVWFSSETVMQKETLGIFKMCWICLCLSHETLQVFGNGVV